MAKRILACFAHPDDESFSVGGSLAKHAAEGAEILLVCTTRGEEGEISDPALATKGNLGEVRERELRCAAAALGIQTVEVLGYRDSGMAGRDSNDDDRAYVQARDEEVVERLVGIIRTFQPQIVITFDPSGAYGHPDHIAIHHHTVTAVAAARDPARFVGTGPEWMIDRLFFTAISKSRFALMREKLAAAGVDTSAFNRPDMPIVGAEDDEIDVTVDVSAQLGAKRRALECHATQFGPTNFMRQLAGDIADEIMGLESFTLWWGRPIPEGQAGDLFAGL